MKNILKAILTRPYYIWKYSIQTIGFLVNYFLLSIQNHTQHNFIIGGNPRVFPLNAFKAEKPNAKITIGNSIIVYRNCDILASGSGNIQIGDDCIIGSDFRLYCKHQVIIGNHVLISWNVLICDYDAHSTNPDERLTEIDYIQNTFFPNFQKSDRAKTRIDYVPVYSSKPVNIGNNVWIGANAMILKGVSIGSGSVIAAGSVVTKDIPENCVAAGNPAKVVKNIWGEKTCV
jgi:galactoside O-acetyltransferase